MTRRWTRIRKSAALSPHLRTRSLVCIQEACSKPKQFLLEPFFPAPPIEMASYFKGFSKLLGLVFVWTIWRITWMLKLADQRDLWPERTPRTWFRRSEGHPSHTIGLLVWTRGEEGRSQRFQPPRHGTSPKILFLFFGSSHRASLQACCVGKPVSLRLAR